MRLSMRVMNLSAGFAEAVIAGMNPPQIPPRSFLEVSPFSYSSGSVWIGVTDADS